MRTATSRGPVVFATGCKKRHARHCGGVSIRLRRDCAIDVFDLRREAIWPLNLIGGGPAHAPIDAHAPEIAPCGGIMPGSGFCDSAPRPALQTQEKPAVALSYSGFYNSAVPGSVLCCLSKARKTITAGKEP
jgi:hypothetical protein